MVDFSKSCGSDFVFDFFCELCIEDNQQKEAEGYCVDCREYLCESCYKAHRKTRATRHHVLQGMDDMPKDTPLSLNRVSKDIATKCKLHSYKPVEYYCGQHDVLGCSTCFAQGHRGCPSIESIVDVSENILDKHEFKDFLGQIQSIEKKSRDILVRARENKTVSQRCCANVVSSVRQLKGEAIAKLNEAEENIVALAEQMKTEDEEKMATVEDDCEAMAGKIGQISSDVETLKLSNKASQLYISMRELQGDVISLQKSIEKIEEENVVRSFRFEANPDLASVLRRSEVLGKVSHQRQQIPQITNPKTNETQGAAARSRAAGTTLKSKGKSAKSSLRPGYQHASASPGAEPASVVDSNKLTASHVVDINVRSDGDTNQHGCWISGSAVVSADRLLLADRNNNKVKLVDTRSQSLPRELKLQVGPWDVAVINTNQAAVTLPDSKKILLLGIADTLTSQRELNVRGTCYGVAYSQDRLVVTFEDSPRVEIIDLRGNVIRRIEKASDGSKLFKRPEYVCVSRDGETIYVSDFDRHTVTSLTFDGVVRSVYKDKKLNNPHQVCTDHHGNVYVCCFSSANVHIITADRWKIKVILTQADGLGSGVSSVSHCQDTNRLFMGIFRSNTIKAFQLL